MAESATALTFLLVISATYARQADVVDTTLGRVQGVRKTVRGNDVDVYYGIPFAKPPVGELRFKRPEPAEPWTDIKSTVTKPNACFQSIDTAFDRFPGVEMWNPNTPMSEDCLYLNVWVPKRSRQPKTIMVWIYGGGFYAGSSMLDVYDGSKLAVTRNVIVVSMNYRVGPLGFLYTGTTDAPGNMGLLDQSLALKWIYDNAANFGGQQNSITIFGESAGSISVGFHLMSPVSTNYFTRAIMQSGSPLSYMILTLQPEARKRARRLSGMLGCSKDSVPSMVQCLRAVSAENVTSAQWGLKTPGIYLDLPFKPVVDNYFLPEDPWTLLGKGAVKDTEILIGVNADEGMYFLLYGFPELFPLDNSGHITDEEFKKLVHAINMNGEEVVDKALMYQYVDRVVPADRGSYREIADDISGDRQFVCPTKDFVASFASLKGRRDVYLYLFQHHLSNNPWPEWTGAMHGYEIEAVFGLPLDYNYTQGEEDLASRMMGYWTRFAQTGNPNDRSNVWPKLTSREAQYLKITAQGDSVGQGLRRDQCSFRSTVLPLLQQGFLMFTDNHGFIKPAVIPQVNVPVVALAVVRDTATTVLLRLTETPSCQTGHQVRTRSRKKTMIRRIEAFFLLVVVSAASAQQADVVNTTLGRVQGLRKTVLGKDVDVYYGIPFAKPPVGELRFKRPEPAEPWTDIKSTVTKPNACFQSIDTAFDRFPGVEMWNPNTPMSEDCLYLNVWVPRGFESQPPNTTMVWIYGGGLTAGSSMLDVYDGSKLAATQNVIVASMNYRLGPLGFLYTGTVDAPGNQGLLDQSLALKWIYDNIEGFGGQQNSITIFGESAGSISVSLHLLSPQSRQYFTRAIMQSGTFYLEGLVMPHSTATERAQKLSATFNCPVNSVPEMIHCLRNVNAGNVTDAQWTLPNELFMDLPVGVAIDGYFLEEDPAELVRQGAVKDTELLMGVNKDEGIYFLVYAYPDLFPFNISGSTISDADFKKLVHDLNRRAGEPVDKAVTYEYVDRVIPAQRPSRRDIADDIAGDRQFRCPTIDFATAVASMGGGRDVYLYSFEHRLSNNPWPEWMGVMHGYEIEAVFGLPLDYNYTQGEEDLASRMMGYWTRFAKTGNPNKGGDTEWPKLTAEDDEHLVLKTDGDSVGQGLRRDQCHFRATVLPLLEHGWPQQRPMDTPRTAFILLFVTSATFVQQADVVNTTLGRVQGLRKTVLGKDVDVYYGIPFAKPPVGELRFKRPEPAEPWTDIKSTVTKPNACFQSIDTAFDRFPGVEMWNPNTPMSEDCLYLNVWVPRGFESQPPNATMVWIYGGGFYGGSSMLDVYDGSKLAVTQNVIVASMNYRLGPLGFLYTGTVDAPGNQGLLDQSLALKWIYDNIERFGGQQNSITIFGESAGSISVGLHLLSPVSMKYFTRAIMQSHSSVAENIALSRPNAFSRTQALLAQCNCPLYPVSSSLMCMQQVSAESITAAQWSLLTSSLITELPLPPVVDGFFLPDDPRTLLTKGIVKDAELLLGVNKDEGTGVLAYRFPTFFPYSLPSHFAEEELNVRH
ncbi:uncharacterized protein LOC143285962 [Babylonia areolata]|uniref:uncharacterized protein LOC143285962 n=1 Tax=Babylonia areolata TaxID=304850 RepID=UPI003FD2C3C7